MLFNNKVTVITKNPNQELKFLEWVDFEVTFKVTNI